VFCLFAVLLIPAASAFGGAAIRYSLGYAYWPAWEQWFMGNALAHLVVTPAIFYLVLGFPWNVPAASLKRWGEGGLLTVGLIVTGFMAFSTGAGEVGFTEPRFYAPVPFLFWAALRFGMLGAAGAITIIAFLSVEAALMDRRPFSGRSPAETALALQQFLLLRAAPLYLVAILVEQKKRDEGSLRESEALNRGIINSLTSRVAILDRSGCIIATNEAWRKSAVLGGVPTAGTKVGVNYLEVCRRAARTGDPFSVEVLAALESVLQCKARQFQKEYGFATSAGALWFEILVLPLRCEAGGVVIKQRDITDRKRAEAEAQEVRQELAHASRVTMLGQLASSLAHELNQPLGAILRNAEAAELFLQSEPPDLDELRAIVSDIRKDDQRAGGIIDRLRALLTRREFDPRPVPLGELVDEVVTLTRSDSATRRIGIGFDLPRDLPLIRGDCIHLQQVLLNLLINGMDALAVRTDRERTLRVRARRDGDGFVEVAVSDSGDGIPAEKLGRLFEPFFTTKPHGMGLGLAISKTIIEAHGGRLWAENNAQHGATFRFTLPVADGGSDDPDGLSCG
jgi:C4-dicarboxylate-specific signal transduction histidine kinase